MRFLACFVLLWLSVWALAQKPFRPDAVLVISEHATGADNVSITMRSATYPRDLFERQLQTLGTLVGVPPRGVVIGEAEARPGDKASRTLRAMFAIDGIIDRGTGKLNIEPILKAFAGAPAPDTVEGLFIIFEGERVSPQTVRQFGKDGVVVGQAKGSVAPPGIEYSIQLLTQNPDKLEWPAALEQKPVKKVTEKPATSNQTAVYLLFILAAVAGGALVYLALLRPSRKPR